MVVQGKVRLSVRFVILFTGEEEGVPVSCCTVNLSLNVREDNPPTIPTPFPPPSIQPQSSYPQDERVRRNFTEGGCTLHFLIGNLFCSSCYFRSYINSLNIIFINIEICVGYVAKDQVFHDISVYFTLAC